MDYESKKVFIINVIFTVIIGLIVFLTLKFLISFLLPFIIAVSLSYILEKPTRYFKKITFLKEDIMRYIFLAVLYLLVAGTLTVAVLSLIGSGDKILAGIRDYFLSDNIFSKILELLNSAVSNLPDSISASAGNIIDIISEKLTIFLTDTISAFLAGLVRFLPSFLISSFVTVVASFYIAKDYKRLIKFTKNMLGDKKYQTLNEIKNILTNTVWRVVSGYLIMAIITFFECFIGLKILRHDNSLIISAIAAFLDMLPVIGVGSVLIPLSIFSFVKGDAFVGVGLVILYIAITVMRNFIEPKIIGKRVDINPLVMLATIFVGLKIGGIYGMFLLPLTTIVIINYYKKQFEKEKGAIS